MQVFGTACKLMKLPLSLRMLEETASMADLQQTAVARWNRLAAVHRLEGGLHLARKR